MDARSSGTLRDGRVRKHRPLAKNANRIEGCAITQFFR